MSYDEDQVWTIKAKPPHAALVRELVALASASWERPELERYLAGRGRLEPGPAGLGLVFHTAGEGFWLNPAVGFWEESGELADFESGSGFWMPFCWVEEEGGSILEGLADDPFGLVDRSGGRAGFDTVWAEACAVFAAELGPATLTTEQDGYHVAVWTVGATAVLVGQNLDNMSSQGDVEVGVILLAQHAGREQPEAADLVDWFFET